MERQDYAIGEHNGIRVLIDQTQNVPLMYLNSPEAEELLRLLVKTIDDEALALFGHQTL